MIRHRSFSVTADASGDGTDTQDVFGRILAIHTDATGTAAGSDVTWTIEALSARDALAETVLTLTDLGANSAVDYPRRAVQDTSGADLGATAGGDNEPFIATGAVKMTVAQGGSGNVVTGSVWYDDGRM